MANLRRINGHPPFFPCLCCCNSALKINNNFVAHIEMANKRGFNASQQVNSGCGWPMSTFCAPLTAARATDGFVCDTAEAKLGAEPVAATRWQATLPSPLRPCRPAAGSDSNEELCKVAPQFACHSVPGKYCDSHCVLASPPFPSPSAPVPTLLFCLLAIEMLCMRFNNVVSHCSTFTFTVPLGAT